MLDPNSKGLDSRVSFTQFIFLFYDFSFVYFCISSLLPFDFRYL
jgi:hypothetical protein